MFLYSTENFSDMKDLIIKKEFANVEFVTPPKVKNNIVRVALSVIKTEYTLLRLFFRLPLLGFRATEKGYVISSLLLLKILKQWKYPSV